MRLLLAFLLLVRMASLRAQTSGADNGIGNILQVKRVYVAALTGGAQADALRELIIAGLNSTKLFILTDNPDRADAILKGAADASTFTDQFDSVKGQSGRDSVTKYNGGSSVYGRAAGVFVNGAGSENESHHINERKHEAFAAVRLCNKDGDVLWSTTQESLGAKFRGASADVAARIARQITLDYERERRAAEAKAASVK